MLSPTEKLTAYLHLIVNGHSHDNAEKIVEDIEKRMEEDLKREG